MQLKKCCEIHCDRCKMLKDLVKIYFKGTAFGKEVEPSNPFNMTGKEFDMAKSGVLAAIMERESAGLPRHTP